MFWPFKRKGQRDHPDRDAGAAPGEMDVFDRAAQNLVAQGIDPAKVERAARMVKKLVGEGVLPEGSTAPIAPPEE